MGPVPASPFIPRKWESEGVAPCPPRFPGAASSSTVTLLIARKELELAFWLPDLASVTCAMLSLLRVATYLASANAIDFGS